MSNNQLVVSILMLGDYVVWCLHEADNTTVKDALYLYNLDTGKKEFIYEKEDQMLEKFKEYYFIRPWGFGEGTLVWSGWGYHYNESDPLSSSIESTDIYYVRLP